MGKKHSIKIILFSASHSLFLFHLQFSLNFQNSQSTPDVDQRNNSRLQKYLYKKILMLNLSQEVLNDNLLETE